MEVMVKAQVMVAGKKNLKLDKQQKVNHPNQGGRKKQQWGRRRDSNETSQKMTRDTDTYYGDSVSTACAVPNANENLRSWTLGIFPANQAVN